MAARIAEETPETTVYATGHRFSEDTAPKLILALDAAHFRRERREPPLKRVLISNQRELLGRLAIGLGIIGHFDFTLPASRLGAAPLPEGGDPHGRQDYF